MRHSLSTLAAAALILLASMISGTGCHRKPTQVTPPPSVTKEAPTTQQTPPAPSPTITLNVSPAAIEKGQSTTLTWTSSNATGVTIDNGVGTVEPSGSRTVSPANSTTYMARATGTGGNAVAEARVTVTAPAAATPPPLPAITDDLFFSTNIKDAFFDYDQYSIRDDARTALQADARAMNERPSIRIMIEGYADERGSEKYNLALGDRRANSVKDFLISQGVSSGRIDATSYGKERSFCEEHNEECWQLNRRAHIVMR